MRLAPFRLSIINSKKSIMSQSITNLTKIDIQLPFAWNTNPVLDPNAYFLQYQEAFNVMKTQNASKLTGNVLTTPSGTYPGASDFAGGVLLSNGKVFCVPLNSTTAQLYSIVTPGQTVALDTNIVLSRYNNKY